MEPSAGRERRAWKALAGMNTCSAANPVTMPKRFPIQGCLSFSRHEDNRTFSPLGPVPPQHPGTSIRNTPHVPGIQSSCQLVLGVSAGTRPSSATPSLPPLPDRRGTCKMADWIREVAGPRATPGTGSPTTIAPAGVSITPILPDARRTVRLLRNPGCHGNGGAARHPPDQPRRAGSWRPGPGRFYVFLHHGTGLHALRPLWLGRCTVQTELLQKGPLTLPVQLPMGTTWESMMPLPPLDLSDEEAVRGIDDGVAQRDHCPSRNPVLLSRLDDGYRYSIGKERTRRRVPRI